MYEATNVRSTFSVRLSGFGHVQPMFLWVLDEVHYCLLLTRSQSPHHNLAMQSFLERKSTISPYSYFIIMIFFFYYLTILHGGKMEQRNTSKPWEKNFNLLMYPWSECELLNEMRISYTILYILYFHHPLDPFIPTYHLPYTPGIFSGTCTQYIHPIALPQTRLISNLHVFISRVMDQSIPGVHIHA